MQIVELFFDFLLLLIKSYILKNGRLMYEKDHFTRTSVRLNNKQLTERLNIKSLETKGTNIDGLKS